MEVRYRGYNRFGYVVRVNGGFMEFATEEEAMEFARNSRAHAEPESPEEDGAA